MGAEHPASPFRTPRRGAALAVVFAVLAGLAGSPVLAGNSPGNAQEAAALQAVNQAKAAQAEANEQAALANQQLDQAQTELAQAQAQLTALQQKVAELDAEIAGDEAEVTRLDAQIAQDKLQLSEFIRASYEGGGSIAMVGYMVDAQNIGDFMDRLEEVGHVAQAGKQLVEQINGEQRQAEADLNAAVLTRQQTEAAQAQEKTQAAIIADDEATDAQLAAQEDAAARQAHVTVDDAQTQLTSIQQALAAAAAAAAAAKARAQAAGTVYPPVAGATFTVDTNLLAPSGENAATLDAFLSGTDLAGLGASYMEAETSYGVSALYLVAHSIEESAWGTSAIAQQKNNLFGFGADDSNPFGDAMTFSSFTACILYVAQFVKQNYLLPTGPFYHGATLQGMNVDYASDPLWASKIAAIADTIPLP